MLGFLYSYRGMTMEKLNAVKVLRYLQEPMQSLCLTEIELIELTDAASDWMHQCKEENNGAQTQAEIFFHKITEVRDAMIGVRLALKRLEESFIVNDVPEYMDNVTTLHNR
jgi:hypothetical protein